MSESLAEAQFNRLSRTILSSPSASIRKEALLEIRKLDHAGLGELYKQVIADDKDDEVRDLAQNLLNKYEIQQALKRGSFETSATIPAPEAETKPEPDWLTRDYPSEPKTTTIGELLESSGKSLWTCRFCGTENIGGDKCASCGAERSRERVVVEEEAPAPRKRKDAGAYDGVFLLQPSNMSYLLGVNKAIATIGSIGAGCTTLFMLPFLAIGLFVIAFAGTEWRNYLLLNTAGVMAQGQYTDKYITTDDDGGGSTYHVDYRYEVNGITYTGSHSVDQGLYARIENGARANIIYASNDPSLSRIEGTNDIVTPIFLTIFSVFWNLISWGIFVATVVGHFRDRQLFRDGQTVRGELLNITTRRDSDGDLQVTAEYSFIPPDGDELIVRKQTAQRNDLKNADLPGKGAPVMVLYKNRKHFRML